MKLFCVIYTRPLVTKGGLVYVASNLLASRETAQLLVREGQALVEVEWTPPGTS